MSHFKEEPTEIELFIKENFNYNEEEDYTFEIEEEGQFVSIEIPTVKEETDGD